MTAFPSGLPDDLDDVDVIRAHDWKAFSSLDRMQNHWARPQWPSGRRAYYWMLPFDGTELVQLAKQCQARLDAPGFDLVPLDALHMTVGRIGFADEATHEVVDRAANAARRRCLRLSPFSVEIGPLAGSRGALRFSVSPWSSLFPMHQALADAVRDAVGERAHMDTRYFRPHLSIAYANTDVALPQLFPVINELRELPPVTATVSEVALVELRREDTVYRFDKLLGIPLGPISPAAARRSDALG